MIKRHRPATGNAKTAHWPFTATRLKYGNTLIYSTLGHHVIEANPTGTEVWRATDHDPRSKPINTTCSVQHLPKGPLPSPATTPARKA